MANGFKRFYDGTIGDDRDPRTVPFSKAEFSNVWAVNRGEIFKTNDLTPFHEEFDSWLRGHDAEVLRRAAETLQTAAESSVALAGLKGPAKITMPGNIKAQ